MLILGKSNIKVKFGRSIYSISSLLNDLGSLSVYVILAIGN